MTLNRLSGSERGSANPLTNPTAGNRPENRRGRIVANLFEISDRRSVRKDTLGEVYRAKHLEDGSEVDLLEIAWISTADESIRRRLLEGVDYIKEMRHPALVKIRARYLEYSERLPGYIAFEAVTGQSLRQEIQNRQQLGQPLAWDEAKTLVAQVADALDQAAAYLPLQRALYPDGIVVNRQNPAKPCAVIVDLNLALLFSDPKDFFSAQPDRANYRSPEEKGGEQGDACSSVYTLGLILLELLQGPLSSEQFNRLVLPANSPEALHKALASQRNERYQTPAELRDALETRRTGSDPQAPFASTGILLQPTTEAVVYDYIEYGNGDGEKHEKRFVAQFMTVGLHQNNDIQLDNAALRGIAERHLCIWRDQDPTLRYTISDLREANDYGNTLPILLDGIPLSSTFGAILTEQSQVQLGDYQIVLKQVASPTRSQARFGTNNLLLPQTRFEKRAGETITIPFTVQNSSAEVIEFLVILDGAPITWQTEITPPQIRFLNPKEERSASGEIEIILPPVNRSEAKLYELNLRLISVNLSAQVTARKLSIKLLPDYRFACRLDPEAVYTRHYGQLLIENQGNLTQTFVVRWSDKEGGLRFEPPEALIALRPATTGIVDYQARTRTPHLLGRQKSYLVNVNIIPEGGDPQLKIGQIFSYPLIPPWLPPLLLLLLAFVATLFATLFRPDFTTHTLLAQQGDQTPEQKIEKPIAGTPFTMQWDSINSCFFSVNENGLPRRWLVRDSGIYTATGAPEGTVIEVQLRNCLFFGGKPWQVVVAPVPTPVPSTPEPPSVDLRANYTETLLGQSGDLCFVWRVVGVHQEVTVKPVIGKLDEAEGERCLPIISLPAQAGIIDFRIEAAYQEGQLPISQTWSLTQHAAECTVNAGELNVREGPGTGFLTRGKLSLGDQVMLRARPFYPFGNQPNEAWIEIQVTANDPRPAWVDFSYLDCQPIYHLLNALPASALIPATPTETPTVTATPTATPTATGTPVPTLTPTPVPQIKVDVQPRIIRKNECVLVTWDIQNVLEIYLNEVGKVGKGEEQDCPTATKTYSWRIKLKDGTYKIEELKVIVNQGSDPNAAPTPPVTQ